MVLWRIREGEERGEKSIRTCTLAISFP